MSPSHCPVDTVCSTRTSPNMQPANLPQLPQLFRSLQPSPVISMNSGARRCQCPSGLPLSGSTSTAAGCFNRFSRRHKRMWSSPSFTSQASSFPCHQKRRKSHPCGMNSGMASIVTWVLTSALEAFPVPASYLSKGYFTAMRPMQLLGTPP